MIKVSIRGLQRVQAANRKVLEAFRPGGPVQAGIKYAVTQLHRYAVVVTHVWRVKGGGLRASHRMEIAPGGLHGRIYIDPSAMNPRGQRPAEYGVYEHRRGGTHAFYQRTTEEAGPRIIRGAIRVIRSGLW